MRAFLQEDGHSDELSEGQRTRGIRVKGLVHLLECRLIHLEACKSERKHVTVKLFMVMGASADESWLRRHAIAGVWDVSE